MVWTPKAGVPSVIRISDVFSIAITGDATWGWLLNWIPYMPQELAYTADFCARGPLTHVDPLEIDDFVQAFLPLKMDLALTLSQRLTRMRHAMEDRVFAEVCEETSAAGWTTEVCVPLINASDNYINPPTGASQLKVRVPLVTGGRLFWFGFNGAVSWSGHNADPPGTTAGWYSTDAWTTAWGQLRIDTPSGPNQFCYSWYVPSATTDWTPVTQVEPAGLLPPPTRSYTTTAELGAELDRIEYKLDQLLAMDVATTAAITSTVTAAAEDPLAAATDEGQEDLPLGARGIMVTVTGIPGYRGARPDNPTAYSTLGWITLRTAWGNYQPRAIVHAVTLIAPLPPYVNGYSIKVAAPMQFTVKPIGEPH